MRHVSRFSSGLCSRVGKQESRLAAKTGGGTGSKRFKKSSRLEAHMLPFGLFDPRERNIVIVAESAHPVFPRRPAQPVRLVVDALEGIQIESRHPGRRQMGHAGDQVRK